MFLIDTAGRNSGRSLGGIPDAGIIDQGTKNIRVKIASIDSMAEHLKGRTGQLNYIDGAIGAIFLYSEVLYPLPRGLQIDQRFIPVVNNVVVEFVYQIRDCSFDLGNFSYTAFVLNRYTEG